LKIIIEKGLDFEKRKLETIRLAIKFVKRELAKEINHYKGVTSRGFRTIAYVKQKAPKYKDFISIVLLPILLLHRCILLESFSY
jgi:hypothetical protein